MKRFYLVLLIVIFQLFILDIVCELVGIALMKYMPCYTGRVAKDNYRLNLVQSDVVIVGPSSAAHNYVPTIICDSINQSIGLNYSCFNAGMDALCVSSTSMAIESIISRYVPKLLIIDISEREFYSTYFSVGESALHYFGNMIVKKYFDDYDKNMKYKMSLGLYRYNNKILTILLHYIGNGDETGYEPKYGAMNVEKAKKMILNEGGEINQYSMRHFNDALMCCKKSNVSVIVFTSPAYHQFEDNSMLEEIVKKYGFKYVDMGNDEYFNQNPSLFFDERHLNDKGARIYSSIIGGEIARFLKR